MTVGNAAGERSEPLGRLCAPQREERACTDLKGSDLREIFEIHFPVGGLANPPKLAPLTIDWQGIAPTGGT
jgi:hypothetical protein